MERKMVLRLVGGRQEGQWVVADPTSPLIAYRYRRLHVDSTRDPDPVGVPYKQVLLVPTGNVEWDGDRCAEVYVPEDMLATWRAEHDLEG